MHQRGYRLEIHFFRGLQKSRKFFSFIFYLHSRAAACSSNEYISAANFLSLFVAQTIPKLFNDVFVTLWRRFLRHKNEAEREIFSTDFLFSCFGVFGLDLFSGLDRAHFWQRINQGKLSIKLVPKVSESNLEIYIVSSYLKIRAWIHLILASPELFNNKNVIKISWPFLILQ